ncbi:MAG: hypothetical protein Q4C40_03675 [Eubacteriales bacterium]|nr:hypothetical protein [Eubacteriales bacterium]
MQKTVKAAAICSTAVFIIAVCFYIYFKLDIFCTLAITFGTTAYHFCMRFAVGYFVNKNMNNRADYTKRRYQLLPFEKKLYRVLHVKQWKNHMPTYDPGLFSPKLHSWDEIAQAMCQAETVHEIIVLFSFFPIVFAIWFGTLPVFVCTSFAAAIFDGMLVIMQRYNRPRVIQLAQKAKKRPSVR